MSVFVSSGTPVHYEQTVRRRVFGPGSGHYDHQRKPRHSHTGRAAA